MKKIFCVAALLHVALLYPKLLSAKIAGYTDYEWRWTAAVTKSQADVERGTVKITLCYDFGSTLQKNINGKNYFWNTALLKETIRGAANSWSSVIDIDFQFVEKTDPILCNLSDILITAKSVPFEIASVGGGPDQTKNNWGTGKYVKTFNFAALWMVPSKILNSSGIDISNAENWYYPNQYQDDGTEMEKLEPLKNTIGWNNLNKAQREQLQPIYLRKTALHEFGHILGLAHEHARPANAGGMAFMPNEAQGNIGISSIDSGSIMNYAVTDAYWSGARADYPTFSCSDVMSVRYLYKSRHNPDYTNCEFICGITKLVPYRRNYLLKVATGEEPEDITTWNLVSCPDPGAGSDKDKDGYNDNIDNCPNHRNPRQIDTDLDGIGNYCDTNDPNDADSDEIMNSEDNCINEPNPEQHDKDGDGIGDECDPLTNGFDYAGDEDNDGIKNYLDRCLGTQKPTNWINLHFGCDQAEGNRDDDFDGVRNMDDKCQSNNPELPINIEGCAPRLPLSAPGYAPIPPGAKPCTVPNTDMNAFWRWLFRSPKSGPGFCPIDGPNPSVMAYPLLMED